MANKPYLETQELTVSFSPSEASKKLAELKARGWEPVGDLMKNAEPRNVPLADRPCFYLLRRVIHSRQCDCEKCRLLRKQGKQEIVLERNCQVPKVERKRKIECSDKSLQKEFDMRYGRN